LDPIGDRGFVPDIFGAPGRGREVVRTRSSDLRASFWAILYVMAPKKKIPAVGASTSNPPVPVREGADVIETAGGTGEQELPIPPADQNRTSNANLGFGGSGNAALLIATGPANSRNGATRSRTPTPAQTPWPPQDARSSQRPNASGARRSLDKDLAHQSRDAQGHHARQPTGGVEVRSPGRGDAPSNAVRSKSTPRSSRHSLPPSPAEALARAQLLLNFLPPADKLDEWRGTIQSLISFTDVDPTHATGQKTGGKAVTARTGEGATTVHSPPRRQWSPTRRNDARGDDSTASSDPRARRDQRLILQERKGEDARTTIER
jgi:hypothetical protein